MKIKGKPEPVSVAIGWDDLWIAAICQSNLEIAGSPRKVFRHRGRVKVWSGRATGWAIERKRDISTKLRIIHIIAARQSYGAKLV